MAEWNFLTNHAGALVCIAHDPDVRLRDISSSLSITERSAFGIVTDLTETGTSSNTKTGAATATASKPICPCLKK